MVKEKNFLELKEKVNLLEEALAIVNGGKGSGNFGHSGRKGKVGGSGKGPGVGKSGDKSVEDYTAKLATKSIKEAAEHEPEVTKDLGEVLTANSSRFEGLAFRLKGQSSLSRKIKTDSGADNGNVTMKALKKASSDIHDNLRYTSILSEKNFGNGASKIMKDLESRGYEFVKVKNTIGNTDGNYRGVNTQVKDKNGYIFELQFHTPTSVKVKEAAHLEYEVARDPKTSEADRKKAEARMSKLFKSIPMPEGVDKIESFNKLK